MSLLSGLQEVDLQTARAARSLPHHRRLDALLAASSRATDHAVGWACSGLLAAALDRQRRAAWIAATATVVVADRATVALKERLRRRRPHLEGLAPLAYTPSPFGFPSSHTASAVAAATASSPLVGSSWLRVVAAAVAASRAYLGVHYPGDVLAGAALGCAVGRLGRSVVGRMAGGGRHGGLR